MIIISSIEDAINYNRLRLFGHLQRMMKLNGPEIPYCLKEVVATLAVP